MLVAVLAAGGTEVRVQHNRNHLSDGPWRRTCAAQCDARKPSVLLGLSAGRPTRAMIEKMGALLTFKAFGSRYPQISTA